MENPEIDQLLKQTNRTVRQISELLKLVYESEQRDRQELDEVLAELHRLKNKEDPSVRKRE